MSRARSALPVAEVLDDVGSALRAHRRVVLTAPPGSGKTTLVPPWLLASGLAGDGEIVVLQPRRVAVRALARRLARGFGEEPGGVVGYQVRLDTRVSARTRVRIVTEGILLARLQRDPELRGIAAVVLDEFHERSLEGDLALALTREVQEALRDDLLLLVMSATLDAEGLAAWLGGCPVVRSDGRLFPVTLGHRAPAPRDPLPVTVAAAVREVVARDECAGGDVLAFLPGVRAIEATRAALAPTLSGYRVDVLHGRMPPAAQDAALDPGPGPRVVLATNIAETSLTIAGIRAVVDSGFAKVMRFEPAVGSGRLNTERISRASADQRAGRAGRLGPGFALRLWSEHEDRALVEHDDPEILRVDLARLALELRAWGVADLASFRFLTPPDPALLAHAEALLRRLRALDADGGLTPRGRRIASVPAHPRVGAFLVAAAEVASLPAAVRWAAALELGREGARLLGEGDLARAVRSLGADGPGPMRALARQLERSVGVGRGRVEPAGAASADADVGALLLAGYPDRVGRRRERGRPQFQLASGRGARLVDDDGAVELVVALEVDAGRRGELAESVVRRWAPIDAAALRGHADWQEVDEVAWDPARERVVAARVVRWGADLVLERRPIPLEDRAAAEAILRAQAEREALTAWGPVSDEDRAALARLVTLARVAPELGLPDAIEGWVRLAIPKLAEGCVAYPEIRRGSLPKAAHAALPWQARAAVERLVPKRILIPSGRLAALEYQVDGPPILAVKVQELFGSCATPAVAEGRLPCVVHLLSPAGRPLQVTQDLESFWTRTWPEVRGEMRSRYPKHHWPEDPLAAPPSQRSVVRRR